MFDTDTLMTLLDKYRDECQEHNVKPTYYGVASHLDMSVSTVWHVVKGMYAADKPYTDTPHVNRCINNQDFRIIRSMFL